MAAADLANKSNNVVDPASNVAAVTPNDSTDLANVSRAIYVGVTGNLAVITNGGQTVTFVGVPAGAIIPIRASRVMSTNTTATSILALW